MCNINATGALSVAQTSTFSGDITVSGSRTNVVAGLVNTQVNGFNSIYFNNTNTGATPTETCQIFSGQGGGLNLCTNTAHPVRLSANRDIESFRLSHENEEPVYGTANATGKVVV